MRRWLARVLVLGAVLVGGVGLGGWLYVEHYLDAPGPLAGDSVIVIKPGSGLDAIASALAQANAIDSPFMFKLAARIDGRDRSLKAGEYLLPAAISPVSLLGLLDAGKSVLHSITIPEGLTVREVFALLESNEVLSGSLPDPPPEGTLLPETYLVPRGEQRVTIVQRMRSAMAAALAEAWNARLPDLPIQSPEEALILASIIEKETSIPAEYPVVAGVFVNRLRKGMRLQTDPTVIYALTEGEAALERPLSRADLLVEHPYNTYMIDGLPPGPIANPGRMALEAAVQPAEVGYLYFVADGSGGHAFATTLSEHNRNVAAWRRIRAGG